MPRSSRSARIQFSMSDPPCPDAQISYARRAISSCVTGLAAAVVGAGAALAAAGAAPAGAAFAAPGFGTDGRTAVGAACGTGLLRTSVRATGLDGCFCGDAAGC